MKNKKASSTLLPEETLKIIIAIICIVFLVILSILIFNMFIQNTKIQQAKSTLEIIEGKIKVYKEKNQSISFIISAPKDYYFYFNTTNICNGKYCLCLAPHSSAVKNPWNALNGYLDESKAVCKVVDDYLVIKNKNYEENVIAIYQSTPCTINKNKEGHISIVCDTGPTSELQRFFNNLLINKK
ncbi:MAG: hypothetical protein QW117_01050 [Candidatus Pacearchaeota archaeon]